MALGRTCRCLLRMHTVSCVVTDVVGGHIIIWRGERFSESSPAMFERMQKALVVTSSLQPFPSMSQAWMDETNRGSWNVLGQSFPHGGSGPSLHFWLSIHWTFPSSRWCLHQWDRMKMGPVVFLWVLAHLPWHSHLPPRSYRQDCTSQKLVKCVWTWSVSFCLCNNLEFRL